MMPTPEEVMAEFVLRGGYREAELVGPKRANGIIEALAAAGHVIVPKEPTEEMIIAGVHHENMGDMAGRYKAMLAAAPNAKSPPTG